MKDKGIYKSDEEVYFAWWLEVLEKNGYVARFEYETKQWYLSDQVWFTYEKGLKTKTKLIQRELMKAHEYGCDFVIQFTEKARHLFFEELDDLELSGKPVVNHICPMFTTSDSGIVYVEVKPQFDQNNMTREFKINQKWVFNKYYDYINLIIPIGNNNCLFSKTFTPTKVAREETYKKAVPKKNKRVGDSKLKYKVVRSLDDYMVDIVDRSARERWSNPIRYS